jgi:hypothetical protein
MALRQWRTVAGSVMALLLVGWIGLYQMGVPVWVPWTPRAEQPDPPRADKAKAAADAEAQRKATEAEQQRLAPTVTTGLFKIKSDAWASGPLDETFAVRSMDECEQKCARSARCDIFSFSK